MFSRKEKKKDFAWEVRKGETSSKIGDVLCTEGNTDRLKDRAGLANCGWPGKEGGGLTRSEVSHAIG